MTTSNETKDIFAALVKCQAEIEGALKDATNPAFKSKYADLSSVIDAAKGPLKGSGLALTIGLTSSETGVALEALLLHSSGQFIKYDPFTVLTTKKEAQGQGSAITYGRRYLTMSILGIPAEDDDGNASVKQEPRQDPKPTPSPVETKRSRFAGFMGQNKDRFTPDQLAVLRTDFAAAGTTDALLDALKLKADAYLAANDKATLEAFEAGGFKPE